MTLKALLAGATAFAMTAGAQADDLQALADEVNAYLESTGVEYRLDYAEILIIEDGDEITLTRFFNDRGNKQMTAHFVPGDTRRTWSGTDPNTIDWLHDTVDQTNDVGVGEESAAIAAAMATWDGKKCSDLGLNGGDVNNDLGLIEFVSGLGGSPFVFADITHAGFFPAGVLPPIALAITLTITFVGGDSNNDGFSDTAFREIYYNDQADWTTGGGDFDIETVALHEVGHGLSQTHFGTAFVNAGSGKLHFAPRALMNGAYSGVLREVKGTDNGGHCSLWADWPNN